MISIITSSVRPDQLVAFQKNIEETIGVPCELLIHDNRTFNWGLCKVYNHYARISKFDILCFFHEDILFHTPSWGEIISDFFKRTPNAGVVGFAGSTVKTQYITNWSSYPKTTRFNLIQGNRAGKEKKLVLNPFNEDFSPVVVLDGMALITTKDVWRESPFDEHTFSGFHLYDLDFTLQTARHHVNYVCHTIKITHLSEGNYSKGWFAESEKLINKWSFMLPYSVESYSQVFIKKCENYDWYKMARADLKHNWDKLDYADIGRKVKQMKTLYYKFKLTRYAIPSLWKKIKQKKR